MTDAAGAVAARYGYDSSGKRIKAFGVLDSDFGYAGMYWHAGAGLYMTYFREYDPDFGRWISRDPIRENDDVNLYAYVKNNFVNRIDALGLAGCDWTLSIGHGHGPWKIPFPVMENHPDTNNSHCQINGNMDTAYVGCGSNALNAGGLGKSLPSNNATGEDAAQYPEDGNDVVVGPELPGRSLAALMHLIDKATDECNKGCGCIEINIHVICQTGGEPNIAEASGVSYLGGMKIKIPCSN